MTTPEPTFAVPLSKLYRLVPIADWAGGGFYAECLLLGEHEFQNIPGAAFPSESEARSAAIAHLATEHGIAPLVEETTSSFDAVKRARKAMRDAFADLITVAGQSGADWETVSAIQHKFWDGNEHLHAEVARLRSAGDGAADVEKEN